MTEGLVWTYEGRLIACLVWASLMLIASVVLALVFGFRNGAQFHTQTDRMTGKRTLGLVSWFLGWAAGLVGPAVLTVIILTGVEVTHWARDNMALTNAVVTGLALLGVVLWAVRLNRKQPVEEVGVEILPVQPVPAPGYFLPEPEQHWDR